MGLVFQDSNLVSGTLDALIQHLVPTPTYYPDRAFIFAFLLSSRLHIRPHELLGTVFRLAFSKLGATVAAGVPVANSNSNSTAVGVGGGPPTADVVPSSSSSASTTNYVSEFYF